MTKDCSSKWEISRSRWSPEHKVPVFTQMSGTIKVRGAAGWGVGVGLEENIDRNRVGVQKEDAASAELAHRLRVAVELVGVEMVGDSGWPLQAPARGSWPTC